MFINLIIFLYEKKVFIKEICYRSVNIDAANKCSVVYKKILIYTRISNLNNNNYGISKSNVPSAWNTNHSLTLLFDD